eukprot:Blabericola_migrator_1__4617@NODE_2449_length_2741_cov_42_451384_g1533_i0_p3_GENE_NODE_2449_length_2741_cov_42_451384_g1533_i0NODE_2449_length_2741_cov_42_451384_g1533_i0_p3_ORF_typecomplete_len171_score12_70MLVIN_C/PF18697_1/0_0017rve_3/PF13683_6/0_0092rve_3/PF13683_6/3_9e03rve/PF00665_26/0_019FUSC/PF04632_12/0_3_NODE_2449_length_2741_cov_42_451384_g1533_i010801592
MANFNTTVVHSAPWHPQGHAHIERFNRQLEQILYNYNQTVHDATGLPPLELLTNRPPPPSIFMDDLLRDIQERRDELELKRQQAAQRAKAQTEESSYHQNLTRYPTRLKRGDFITIRTHSHNKLAPRFEGCYEIENITGNTITRQQGLRWMMNLPFFHTQKGARLFDGFR